MAKVKLELGKLAKAGYSSAESVRIVQALEAAHIQVQLQIQGTEGMKLLGQLPAVQPQPAHRPTWGLIGLWLAGVLASLVAIAFGWLSLLR